MYNTTSKKDDNKPSAIPQHQNGGAPQKKGCTNLYNIIIIIAILVLLLL